MKLRSLLPVLGLVLTTTGVRAQQAGLYFNPIVTPVSLPNPDSGVFAFLGNGVTSRVFGGVSIGGYYNVAHQPKFDVGVDLRDELEHGNSALLNSFLVGVRLAGNSTTSKWRPYVQLSAGVGTTKSPLNVVRASKAMFKVYGGADYRISRHLDFRAVEVGYGSLTTISTSQYASATAPGAARLISFTSGLVFRLP